MAIIQGTHSGIRSLFQNDETITDAKKTWDEVEAPWLQGFVFRSYDSTKTKAWKFAKNFFTLGLAPYIALLHDLIVFDKMTIDQKLQTTFGRILEGINQDAERMLIETTNRTINSNNLVGNVFSSFAGNRTNTALFLRTIGQGPANRLKDIYTQRTGRIVSTNEDEKSKVFFNVKNKTVTVVGYFIHQSPPTGRDSEMTKYDLQITATFNFNEDTINYAFQEIFPNEETRVKYMNFDEKATYISVE